MSFVLQAPQAVSPLVAVYQTAAQAVANFADVKVELKQIGVPDVPKVTPFGTLPALVTPQGTYTGVNAIKAIVKGNFHNKLAGVCPGQAIKVDELLSIVPTIVELTQALAALEKTKSTDNDKINALNKLVVFVKGLNAGLVANTFLLGNNISIADIVIAIALQEAFAKYFGPKKRQEISSVFRLYQTVMGQKAVKKVVPEVVLMDKDVYLMPDMAALTAKPAEKAVDPFAALPKSPMHLDSVKKLYGLQQPFNPEFATAVWDQFDSEGYSLYKITFKYNADEWEKEMFCHNGVSGFLNRGEQAKRNVFMILNMVKVGNFYHIYGAAIVRGGKEFNAANPIPVAFQPVSDAEEYDFTYLDAKNEDDKKTFLNLFCNVGELDGNQILTRFQLK